MLFIPPHHNVGGYYKCEVIFVQLLSVACHVTLADLVPQAQFVSSRLEGIRIITDQQISIDSFHKGI
jgi:hypothetical protein